MTTFILIRHGEPRYDEIKEKGIYGMAYNFARLTENGIEQSKTRAKDSKLKDAEIIISSPFTRSLQTAANIASTLGLDVIVEHDLHEWLPDKDVVKDVDGEKAFETYMNHLGKKSTTSFEYETYDEVKKRMELVLLKYTKYRKVIVVSHGIAISALTLFDDIIEHCGVREITI